MSSCAYIDAEHSINKMSPDVFFFSGKISNLTKRLWTGLTEKRWRNHNVVLSFKLNHHLSLSSTKVLSYVCVLYTSRVHHDPQALPRDSAVNATFYSPKKIHHTGT